MIDIIITYTDETIFTGEESTFKGSKTPAVTNGSEFMRLVRVMSEEDVPVELTVLGTYEEVFADAAKKAFYDNIYKRRYAYTDENGIQAIGMKPERFGEFA